MIFTGRHSLRGFSAAMAFLLTALPFHSPAARAAGIVFTLDSSQSYLTLAIPNFTVAGTTVNITGQNRTNGAPVSGSWTSTTGNKAFLSGSFATTIGGNFDGGIINSVQFVAGSSTLTALASGNYRPNPAAYNSTSQPAQFNNNSSQSANYGGTAHVSFGNAAYFSLSNTTLDMQSAAPIAVTGLQFPVNQIGTPLITGLSTTTLSMQGLSVLLLGNIIPSTVNSVTGLSAADTSATPATFVYAPFNSYARLTIPLSVPFSIPLGGGSYFNGTATGQLVALSPITPEPSTLCLAGLGLFCWTVVARRRSKRRTA